MSNRLSVLGDSWMQLDDPDQERPSQEGSVGTAWVTSSCSGSLLSSCEEEWKFLVSQSATSKHGLKLEGHDVID